MKVLTDEKLTIVGAAGMIGSNMAQTALMMGLTSNICLYDPFAPALEGVAEEMFQSGFEYANITYTSDISEALRGAKYVVSSGGAARKAGMTREDLLKGNAEIAAQFGKDLRSYCPDVKHVVVIFNPADITGLANGTKKEAKSLKLPSVVVIETTSGNMNATVSWDVKNCSYDPSDTDAQSFRVQGTVKLPEGVDNDKNLELKTSVKVSVKAYTSKTVSADQNKITGIEYNGVYTTQSRISFTAVGAGMDNASPRKGDTRYLPLNWTVINTNNWDAAPYTATFGLAQSGDYTLKVTFQLQTYDGKTWKSSETYDTKSVPFTISKAKVTAPGQNLTPAANRKNAVKTGDDSPIAVFVVILVVATAAIAGVIIYRKKK